EAVHRLLGVRARGDRLLRAQRQPPRVALVVDRRHEQHERRGEEHGEKGADQQRPCSDAGGDACGHGRRARRGTGWALRLAPADEGQLPLDDVLTMQIASKMQRIRLEVQVPGLPVLEHQQHEVVDAVRRAPGARGGGGSPALAGCSVVGASAAALWLAGWALPPSPTTTAATAPATISATTTTPSAVRRAGDGARGGSAGSPVSLPKASRMS